MPTLETTPKRRLRDVRAAAYSELILGSAERVFGREGYEATKVQEVAREAGISLGTLYDVFPGKVELWRAIHERHLSALFEASFAAMAQVDEDDTLGRLLAGVGAYVRYLVSRPDYLRLHLMDGTAWGLGVGIRSPVELKAWEKGKGLMTQLIEHAVAEGILVDEDPELTAQIMIGMHQVRLAHWIKRGMRADAAEVVAQIQELTIRAFCSPAVASKALAKLRKKAGRR